MLVCRHSGKPLLSGFWKFSKLGSHLTATLITKTTAMQESCIWGIGTSFDFRETFTVKVCCLRGLWGLLRMLPPWLAPSDFARSAKTSAAAEAKRSHIGNIFLGV